GPLVAILGFAMCIYMMSGLNMATWIRFVVWFIVGVTIYAAYGYRTSMLGRSREANAAKPAGAPGAR
ncbi:MAG TPA: amino acid permease C-terminal domain-containing protein, partial [Candidatus Eremiobacteraceae bacterium]|nr:amino acid permease C-terminal domain-containing protein [Candidatus Eremiobacteraceae bacterium]